MTTLEIPTNSEDQRRQQASAGLAHYMHRAIELDIPCISEIDLYGEGDPNDKAAHTLSHGLDEAFDEYQLLHRANLSA